MQLKTIIYRLVHIGATLRNYERLEEYAKLADQTIMHLKEENNKLRDEILYLPESDKLFHRCEEQARHITSLNEAVKRWKAKSITYQKSNDLLLEEVNKLYNQLHPEEHGKETHHTN